VDDEAAEGGAALAGGAHGGEGDGAEGEVEVGGGATMAALLPPSSRMARAKRAARRGATVRPMAVEPVAETRGMSGESTSCWPTVASPMRRVARPLGMLPNDAWNFFAARSKMAWVARAVRGVFSEGFRRRRCADQSEGGVPAPHGDGEVEGGMMPTTPRGCQVSSCGGGRVRRGR